MEIGNYVLGVDIGSTTSKCIILEDGQRVVGQSVVVAGTGTKGPEQAVEEALKEANLSSEDISFTLATGYGRNGYEGADAVMSELSCHTRGTRQLFPNVKTIIDIGGQDAKVMSVNDKGQMTNFLMNDKCAAGTGRFLDVMATILQLDINDLEKEAAKSEKPVKISSTCTVFAESEVISQLSTGVALPDLVAGICESVAVRVSSLAKRIGVKEDVCMSGGVAKNGGVRNAMAQVLGVKIHYSPMAQLIGALGAALIGYDKYKKLKKEND